MFIYTVGSTDAGRVHEWAHEMDGLIFYTDRALAYRLCSPWLVIAQTAVGLR